MSAEPVLGWDVGGAHLKAARLDAMGRVTGVSQLACPLWQGLEHLHRALDATLQVLGTAPRHAITMTGEMVDLFPDREAGVTRLVATLMERLPGAELHFYAGPDGFLPADRAAGSPVRIASANWMATAELVAATLPAAILCDIGSTTTDLVPVLGGRVVAHGRNDFDRLVTGELVYTGVVRTPLMALAREAPFEGERVPLVAEYFATTADVYRLLESLPDGADLHPAADAGAKSLDGSAARLARMIGRDAASAPRADWLALARWLSAAQVEQIMVALQRVSGSVPGLEGAPLVAAGVGRFLLPEIAGRLTRATLDFSTLVPQSLADPARVSDCAPAVAVALLLGRMLAGGDLAASPAYLEARLQGLCHDGAMEVARGAVSQSPVSDGPPRAR